MDNITREYVKEIFARTTFRGFNQFRESKRDLIQSDKLNDLTLEELNIFISILNDIKYIEMLEKYQEIIKKVN